MSDTQQLRFAPAVQSMFDFIAPHREWIERAVGTAFSNTVTLEVETPLAQSIVGRFLKGAQLNRQSSALNEAMVKAIRQWKVPPNVSPRVVLSRSRDDRALIRTKTSAWNAEWMECPIALWLTGLSNAVVAVNVPHVSFAQGLTSDWKHWIIVNKTEVADSLKLLDSLLAERSKFIMVYGAHPIPLPPGSYSWDKLVLDSVVTQLVRRDFETLFEREEWFRQNGLPFHRGYLFYGPPGNGKTSVLRVMAAYPAVNACTINLRGKGINDDSLTELFELAYGDAPALVIFEDIDRHFPSGNEERHCKVSLQHFLNCLDGVALNDGLIVVGTANDPTKLDAAILKRPGRFDRVVPFKNPDSNLRLRYLAQLANRFDIVDLEVAVAESEGFSFAQLRESYILASQLAFEETREITPQDLQRAIEVLKAESFTVHAADSSGTVGFRSTGVRESSNAVQRAGANSR